MSECVFCQIVAGDIPAEIVHQDSDVVAFRDANPEAPVHLLVVPRDHVQDINELDDSALMQKLIATARRLGADHDAASHGYRIAINSGPQADIPHLHMHILTGEPKLGRIASYEGGD